MLTQEDFYDRAKDFSLLTDTDGKCYTFEEYQKLIKDNQTDKDGNTIYLYANHKEEQFSYIDAAKNKGYNVLLMDGQLDIALVSMLEQKFEKSRFTRVDSDVISNLIVKEEPQKEALEPSKQEALSAIFKSQLPKLEKVEFNVTTQALGENSSPVMITQSEYMRRMKDMAAMQPGMNFYGQMPDMYSLVINTEQKAVKEIIKDAEESIGGEIEPIRKVTESFNSQISELREKLSEKNADKDTINKQISDLEAEVTKNRSKEEEIIKNYASGIANVKQIIDLALLQNGLLKGEALSAFIRRSASLL